MGLPEDAHPATSSTMQVLAGDETISAPGPTRPAQGNAPPLAGGELPAGTQVGRYTVLRRIGSGGMGVVHLAVDPELDRRVALKLLRADKGSFNDSDGRSRLLREAQAMAKLSHPNVLTVFDVGSFVDQVFIAMEYVRGTTLREWCAVPSRTLRDVFDAFAQSGRGLAAAHAAGILHRDFKPENVLVDETGRARVLDFGLARASPVRASSAAELAVGETAAISGSALGLDLTRAGAIMGTPAYMPSEQLLGEPLDARADEFAFCAALFETLYGVRPFVADTLAGLMAEVTAGRIRAVKRLPGVPRGVHRAVVRGLSSARTERFASMDELLAAIERGLREPARRRIAAGAVLAVGLVGGVLARASVRPPPPSPCCGAAADIAGSWNGDARGRIAKSFRDTGSESAEPALARVTSSLDAYAATWAASSREACEATRVRGTQSDEALDLRSACLEQRKRELGASIVQLESVDRALVERSTQVVAALTPVTTCADVAALRVPFAVPRDPATRAAIDHVRAELAESKARFDSGRYAEEVPIASQALEDARKVAFRPLEGEALYTRGTLALSAGEPPERAVDLLFASAVAASATRDDRLEVTAFTTLVHAAGYRLERYDDADRYGSLAEAAIDRIGGDPVLAAKLATQRANVANMRGDRAAAIPLYRHALELRVAALGADAEATIEAEENVAELTEPTVPREQSLAVYRDIEARLERALGDRHPALASALDNVGRMLTDLGRYDEAIVVEQRASALARGTTLLPAPLFTLGAALLGAGRSADGWGALNESMAGWEKRFGAASLSVAVYRIELGRFMLLRSRTPIPVARDCDRWLPDVEKGTDPTAEDLSDALAIAALAHTRTGAIQRGRAEAERAIAIGARNGLRDDVHTAMACLAEGEIALAEHRAVDARAPLERALETCTHDVGDPMLRGDVRSALARAVGAAGDAASARELEVEAAADYTRGFHPELAAKARGAR